ncbi:MAG: hypothetical protein WC829_02810 [Hyphomicrobium sp.]
MPAAVLAVLAIAAAWIDNPLIKRLFCNLARKTHTTIDDWVAGVLYADYQPPPPEAPQTMEEVQERIDAMTPEEKAEAQEPVPLDVMPWMKTGTDSE